MTYQIFSRSRNRVEPVTGETPQRCRQNYVEYRRRVSGTNFNWKYYEQRGYVVQKLSKISDKRVNSSKLV